MRVRVSVTLIERRSLMQLLREWAMTAGWAMVGAICLAITAFIVVRLFDRLTPGKSELESVHEGNVAAAILLGSLIIALAIVIASAIRLL